MLWLTFLVAAYALPENVYWEQFGSTSNGRQYSPLRDINTQNAGYLQLAWQWSLPFSVASYQKATPLVVPTSSGSAVPPLLVFCTSPNIIYALDAYKGTEVWRQTKFRTAVKGLGSCRGISYWENPYKQEGAVCKRVIFMATMDVKIVSLDVETGAPCTDFGQGEGYVPLPMYVNTWQENYVSITAPPVVIDGVVASGCAITDFVDEDMPKGRVWGVNATTGDLVWTYIIVPSQVGDYGWGSWWNGTAGLGAANVWGAMSALPELGLIYMGTSSPSVDMFGGLRNGSDVPSDSVIAVEAKTGKVRWSFQTVHHDLWDYDIGAQPIATTIGKNHVVIIATKVGFVFVLDALTGKPVYPVEEVPVPKTTVPGEWSSPTQPWPKNSNFTLSNVYTLDEQSVWAPNLVEHRSCIDFMQQLTGRQTGSVFTPPSLTGSIYYPGMQGGVNWGSCSHNNVTGTLACVVVNMPMAGTLYPRTSERPSWCSWDYDQKKTPFKFCYTVFKSTLGYPCAPPPWTKMVALNITSGATLWEKPLGYHPASGFDPAWGSGSHSGAPIITGGDVVIAAGTEDKHLYLFDANNGKTLAAISLPYQALGTPITYRVNGTQFVAVISVENGIGSVLAYSL